MIKACMCMAAVAVMLATAPQADYDAGVEALERRDFATAYKILRPLAEEGDSGAQYSLGLMYLSGWGVKKDWTEAGKWFRRAADQGDEYSKLLLAIVLDAEGKFVEAANLYRFAADKGEASAQFRLGQLYLDGRGVPKDPAEAAKLFRRAAEQGYAEGQEKLGILLFEGVGIRQDASAAVKLWLKAAAQGKTTSKYLLGQAYYRGAGVEQDYVEAARWFRLAAQEGDEEAQYMLGVMHNNGEGLPKDPVKGLMWFLLADAQNYEPAAKVIKEISPYMSQDQIAAAKRLAREWRHVK